MIHYTLPKEGRISLAIYNADGQMVRTLRSAEPQKAGEQKVTWDGLDQDGKPVPPGEYRWKLLLSQGMKAEYLLSLGTSTGIQPWVGQHGGPNSVAVEGDTFTVGGGTEVAPLIVRAKLDGDNQYALDYLEFTATRSLAIDRGITYVLMATGRLFSLDSATGRKLAPGDGPNGPELLLPVSQLAPIPLMAGTKTVTIPVGTGRYLLRVTSGNESAPSAAFKSNGDFQFTDFPATESGKFTTRVFPKRFGAFNPVKGTNGELKQTFYSYPNDPKLWSVAKLELVTPAEAMDARFGEVVVTFPALGLVAWLDPRSGEILDKLEVPDGLSGPIALVAPGEALVINGGNLVKVFRDGGGEVRTIPGVTAPRALAFDPLSSGVWIADGGDSQQVKFIDRDFNLKKTFGRKGGRLPGAYVPEDFSEVAAIAADGSGGFLITEANSAPRRTARFDAHGKLLREWYGGQQFYTFAAPDPEDADILWMDTQWGWLMQVKVDWDKRTWKVLATYRWGDNYPDDLFYRYKMAQPHRVIRLDLDKDGQKEIYLYGNNGVLQKVDEKAGRLRAVSAVSMIGWNRAWGWDKAPLEKQPKQWLDAIAQLGEDPAKELKNYRAFAWADANGDAEFQANEFRLAKKIGPEGKGGFLIQDDLSVLKMANWGNGQPGHSNWTRYPLQGFTASGAPIWDWSKSEPFSVGLNGNSQDILVDPLGDVYQIFQRAGDGFKGMDTYGMGHGFAWPANLVGDAGVWKWNREGKLLWRVGQLAYSRSNTPGQLHAPVRFAGLVNGTIGVCDKVVQPVTFWTEDGLYAGSLFDRRAEDALPNRVYSWWNGGTDDYNPETGRALIQYDMMLGGSLLQRPNGEVIFIGSGWNNCPAFRVTGWDEFERQSGTVSLVAPAPTAVGQGTGLKGEFFANPKWEGTPAYVLTTPRIWFESARSQKLKKPDWNWPGPPPSSSTSAASPAASVSPQPAPEKPALPALKGPVSARWTGWLEPRFSEEYTFALYRMGGSARLWVGGQEVVGAGGGNKAFSRPIALEAGKKVAIQVEWTGPLTGELHLNWVSRSQPIEHIPTTALYSESAGVKPPILNLRSSVPRVARAVPGKPVPPPPTWILTRTGNLDVPVTLGINWTGSAIPGVDYEPLPKQITLAAGQKELRLPVKVHAAGPVPAASVTLRGQPLISSDYVISETSESGLLLISDPRIQRVLGVNVSAQGRRLPNSPYEVKLHEENLIRLVDGSGLDQTTDPATHSTNILDAWFIELSEPDGNQLTFDLGEIYQLADIRLWNLNTRSAGAAKWGQGTEVESAAQQVRISVAVNSDGPWTEGGETNLRVPSGASGDPGQLLPVGKPARFVRLNFAGPKYRPMGLAEVEFYGVKAAKP